MRRSRFYCISREPFAVFSFMVYFTDELLISFCGESEHVCNEGRIEIFRGIKRQWWEIDVLLIQCTDGCVFVVVCGWSEVPGMKPMRA